VNSTWTKRNDVEGVPCRFYYERTDGAYVWRTKDEYWAKPWLPGHRGWVAFGPGGDNEPAINFERYGRNHPRRWKTPEAAMKVVDELYPL
jgi:hypothetical protein